MKHAVVAIEAAVHGVEENEHWPGLVAVVVFWKVQSKMQ
eukprot:CAMPEP_0194528412 /NCGR_PEP_ID=MMETSP0253-20130528/64815_1 /TAXON_ID=2966 /ORGANISM="Noctiluca scintillans" /LENGTH=38 /DNA_ID= /DNA_START= /DNA_END= /DNA_ORIENTATION=